MPEQRQLFEYWLQAAGARAMPDRGDVHPAHFAKLLPGISLIETGLQGRCRIRLAGTRLREIYEREITGLHIDELDWGEKKDYWAAAFDRAFNEGKPVQGVVRGPHRNKEHLVQYWLKLPLSVAGAEGVGMLLCLDCFQSVSMLRGEEPKDVVAVGA
jgi:hypothetical protein